MKKVKFRIRKVGLNQFIVEYMIKPLTLLRPKWRPFVTNPDGSPRIYDTYQGARMGARNNMFR